MSVFEKWTSPSAYCSRYSRKERILDKDNVPSHPIKWHLQRQINGCKCTIHEYDIATYQYNRQRSNKHVCFNNWYESATIRFNHWLVQNSIIMLDFCLCAMAVILTYHFLFKMYYQWSVNNINGKKLVKELWLCISYKRQICIGFECNPIHKNLIKYLVLKSEYIRNHFNACIDIGWVCFCT